MQPCQCEKLNMTLPNSFSLVLIFCIFYSLRLLEEEVMVVLHCVSSVL